MSDEKSAAQYLERVLGFEIVEACHLFRLGRLILDETPSHSYGVVRNYVCANVVFDLAQRLETSGTGEAQGRNYTGVLELVGDILTTTAYDEEKLSLLLKSTEQPTKAH